MENVLTEKHFQKPVQQTAAPLIAKFTNFSNEDFIHTWNGIPYTFPAHSVKFMEFGLANHFAKHLINRELLKHGRENDTSPKPNSEGVIENPYYMELYNKCIERVNTDGQPMDQTKAEQEAIDMSIKANLKEGEGMNSNMNPDNKGKNKGKNKAPESPVVPKEEEEFEELLPPEGDDEDEGSEPKE